MREVFHTILVFVFIINVSIYPNFCFLFYYSFSSNIIFFHFSFFRGWVSYFRNEKISLKEATTNFHYDYLHKLMYHFSYNRAVKRRIIINGKRENKYDNQNKTRK